MNLTMRLLTILLAGFVIVQMLIWATMSLPSATQGRPYNLPSPAELRLIVDTLEHTAPDKQAALVEVLNGSTYTLQLQTHLPPRPARDGEGLGHLQRRYQAALGGRWVSIHTTRPRLGRLAGDSPWPIRFFAPIRLSLPLVQGNFLSVASRPSPVLRDYLRQRALWSIVAGSLVLGALALAVRQVTLPLVRLAEKVETFSLDGSDIELPTSGPRELRGLAEALNRMRQRIRELVGERTRMLAAIAHDMRTYLTRLRLRIELIDDPAQRARASADLAEMAALLDDTLLYAQPHAPRLETAFDAADQIRALIDIRRESGDPVKLVSAAQPALVQGSPLSLRRILENLIDNGLRHGTSVEVEIETISQWLTIHVRDDGPGVPEDALSQLGQPFTRLDPSRDRTTGGAGLGLAIVRALVDGFGGALGFRNRPSGGFEATISLPLSSASE